MGEPWGGPDDVCPKCGSGDWMPADEGMFASCNDCGFIQYDEWTKEIMRQVDAGTGPMQADSGLYANVSGSH